jgi:hypothetical protein
MSIRRLPDFIIIGAAKSGTTSLYDYLMQHPNVFMSHIKEPCFFDEAVAWDKGLDWYSSLFNAANENQLCGEASTNYTRWPQVQGVPTKIKKLIPNVKLVYIIRNPVDRAYSHYVHRWTKEVHPGKPFSQDFFEYASTDPMCIDSSMYAMQLDHFLEDFEKDQILVIVFEELLQKPGAVLTKLREFLCLKDIAPLRDQLPFSNENKLFRYHVVRTELTSQIKRIWGVKTVLKMLPMAVKDKLYNSTILKTNLANKVAAQFDPPPLTAQDQVLLKSMFTESNYKLAELWGVDTSYWS